MNYGISTEDMIKLTNDFDCSAKSWKRLIIFLDKETKERIFFFENDPRVGENSKARMYSELRREEILFTHFFYDLLGKIEEKDKREFINNALEAIKNVLDNEKIELFYYKENNCPVRYIINCKECKKIFSSYTERINKNKDCPKCFRDKTLKEDFIIMLEKLSQELELNIFNYFFIIEQILFKSSINYSVGVRLLLLICETYTDFNVKEEEVDKTEKLSREILLKLFKKPYKKILQ